MNWNASPFRRSEISVSFDWKVEVFTVSLFDRNENLSKAETQISNMVLLHGDLLSCLRHCRREFRETLEAVSSSTLPKLDEFIWIHLKRQLLFEVKYLLLNIYTLPQHRYSLVWPSFSIVEKLVTFCLWIPAQIIPEWTIIFYRWPKSRA